MPVEYGGGGGGKGKETQGCDVEVRMDSPQRVPNPSFFFEMVPNPRLYLWRTKQTRTVGNAQASIIWSVYVHYITHCTINCTLQKTTGVLK